MTIAEVTVEQVWEKGKIVSNNDPNVWRKDECGAWINRNQYGNRNSDYGWEIYHIVPEADGGGDELSNLRPLQWENNASRQDGPLTCPVTASKTKNVKR